MDLGAVETLICWENLEWERVTVRNNATDETEVLFLKTLEENLDKINDKETGIEREIIDRITVVEWLVDN